MLPVDSADDINEIVAFLNAGEELGIVLPLNLKEKLDALSIVVDRKLRVALVGGFSEGKTALAAAWLGRRLGDMKISQSESSDAIMVYDAGDGIEMVDTPGLFGFKEKANEAGEVERYKDITRKYVSEADLLLYVLDPSNPIKDSHRDDLIWLFRDLHLLPRTVFVLGRFDAVADMADAEDYAENLAIKRDNVRDRLQDLLHLSDGERGTLSIVGISAAPGGRSVDKWRDSPDEFMRLSRIDELRRATAEKLSAVGGGDEAKRATCLTILSGVTQDVLIPARDAAEESARQAALADQKAKEERPRLQRYREEAAAAQIAIRTQVLTLFSNALREVKAASMEDFEECFDRVVGHRGIVLDTEVRNVFTRELGPVDAALDSMAVSFVEYQQGEVAAGALAQKIIGGIASAPKATGKNVLATRDRWFKNHKFKPWGAGKLADRVNSTVGATGLAIDALTWLHNLGKQEQLEQRRAQIVAALEQQRGSVLARVEANDFLPTYFPQLTGLEALFASLTAEFREAVERSRRVREWANQADILRGRYRLSAPDLLIVEATDQSTP